MEKTTPFPIETATCRDILEFTDPDHGGHTMDGATVSKASIDMLCTCGDVLTLTAEQAEAANFKLGDIASLLKRRGQTGRKQS